MGFFLCLFSSDLCSYSTQKVKIQNVLMTANCKFHFMLCVFNVHFLYVCV